HGKLTRGKKQDSLANDVGPHGVSADDAFPLPPPSACLPAEPVDAESCAERGDILTLVDPTESDHDLVRQDSPRLGNPFGPPERRGIDGAPDQKGVFTFRNFCGRNPQSADALSHTSQSR